MSIQALNPADFNQKVQQIRAYVPQALIQRGILSKFTSWRLTQDPGSGLVVLFGILNAEYISLHSQTPLTAYLDRQLLQELAADLQVQVIPSNPQGLRYAFILDKGRL